MAYTHDGHTAHGPNILRRIGVGFVKMLEAMMKGGQANQCRLEAERLSGFSDAQLAKLGIERDQIMYHAYRRYMYI
jgi:uncharacterized protein YjiS (DUF1127 family)